MIGSKFNIKKRFAVTHATQSGNNTRFFRTVLIKLLTFCIFW
jgi:hypothetical protein